MIDQSETQEAITATDLMAMGMNHIAYVRPVEVEGRPAYMVHAADGTQMAVFADRDLAFAAVRRHDMEPYSVH